MSSAGARVSIVGANGTLGSEVLLALSNSPLRVREILPIGTEASLPDDVEFRDEIYPVVVKAPNAEDLPSLAGMDLVILCAPPDVSLDFARAALRAQVPCIDCSGSLATSSEVPLRVAAFPADAAEEGQPLVATPPGAALSWALVLRPLQELAGLRRVVGTVLEAASCYGRRGIETLHSESIALFNQQEAQEPEIFGRPIAFDCFPSPSDIGEEGQGERDLMLTASVRQILGEGIAISATSVQVPSFLGHASSLVVELEQEVDVKKAADALSRAKGVEVWQQDEQGPSLRAAAGSRDVLVGRLRRDPSAENALALWMVADTPALAAANAVDLAVARLHVN